MYRRPVGVSRQFQARQREVLKSALLLQGPKALGSQQTQGSQGQAEGLITATAQTPEALTHQHRGTATVAPLEMELRHGDLKQTLKHRAHGTLGLMPQRFEAVVAGVPVGSVEMIHRLPQPGVGLQQGLLIGTRSWGAAHRLAGFFTGSLRSRIDSGVTSSISSGPMYSRARSRVIWIGDWSVSSTSAPAERMLVTCFALQTLSSRSGGRLCSPTIMPL